MLTLKSKQANALAEALLNVGRLEELKRFEGHISSEKYSRRANQLRERIDNALEKLEEKEEKKSSENLQLKIIVNDNEVNAAKEKKSVSTRLKEFFSVEEEDEELEGLSIIKRFITGGKFTSNPVIGRIINEL